MVSLIRSIFGMWRRASRDVSQLQLWEVLRRRGTRRAAARDERALAFAVERCTVCRSTTECEHILAAGQDEKIHAFCPNVMYLKHLDAMKRHAPKEDLLADPTGKR